MSRPLLAGRENATFNTIPRRLHSAEPEFAVEKKQTECDDNESWLHHGKCSVLFLG